MTTKTKNELMLSNGMVVTEETITPNKAGEYLKNNVTNRKVSKEHVEYLAHIIKTGNWSMTHQGIAFDKKGALLDGQHRLHAIIQAGMDVQALVFRATHVEDRTKIDYGRVRTINDIFRMEGISNAQYRASVYRMLMNYARGNYTNYGKMDPQVAFQMHDAVGAEVGICIGILLASPNTMRKAAPIAGAVALYLTVDHDRKKEFLDFLRRIKTGIGLAEGDPELFWREWYYKTMGSDLRATAFNNTAICYLDRAWTYHLEGRHMKRMFIRKETDNLDRIFRAVRNHLNLHGVQYPTIENSLAERLEKGE